jgi:hypothetical protein
MSRSPGRQVSANRLSSDGPPALTCWQGEFHGFPGTRLCGFRLSHCEGEGCLQGIGNLIAVKSRKERSRGGDRVGLHSRLNSPRKGDLQ